MTAAPKPRSASGRPAGPKFVHHPSFDAPGGSAAYAAAPPGTAADYDRTYMPDDVTLDYARRMHYAAYRAGRAGSARAARRWVERYYRLRDGVVLGNRKLIYRAV